MLRELRALSGSLHARMLSTMLKDSNIFGLLGNDLDSRPAVKIAFVSFRGTQTAIDWKHDLDALCMSLMDS
jgi:hypothetical protein